MKAVVIGAKGFLGTALAAYLEQKEITVVRQSYRPSLRKAFFERFEAELEYEPPFAVFNAGGSQNGNDDPDTLQELIDSNVFLPAAIASLIIKHSPTTCLVSFGTSWQIGEKGKLEPFNAYAATKSAAECMLDHFSQDGLRIVTLRLYDTYGPGDRRNKIVNLIADALLRRVELPMTAGEQIIDLTYIDDVLRAVDCALKLIQGIEDGAHCVYSIRSKQTMTILQLLDMMARIVNVENTFFIKPGVYSYRKRERFALPDVIPTPPGWFPKVRLEDGLQRVLQDRRKK